MIDIDTAQNVALGLLVLVVIVFGVWQARHGPAQIADDRMWTRAIAEIERMRLDLTDLRKTVAYLYQLLDEYMRGVRILIAQVLRLGEQPEWTPPPVIPIQEQQQPSPPARLLLALETLFSLEELEVLAANVGASPGSIAGETIRARALGLVEWCKRRDKTSALCDAVSRERPNARVVEV